jgi:hypothetical protein
VNIELRRKVPDLLNLDWEKLRDLLATLNPNDNTWYMITVNKGQSDEYRTKFLTYTEAKELIGMALEKKRLRVSPTP